MRLTTRKGCHVYINTKAIPRENCKGEYGFMPCQFMITCERVKDRSCPIFMLLDKLADYEDNEEFIEVIKHNFASEIFAEIEKLMLDGKIGDKYSAKVINPDKYTELKNKYTKEGVGE